MNLLWVSVSTPLPRPFFPLHSLPGLMIPASSQRPGVALGLHTPCPGLTGPHILEIPSWSLVHLFPSPLKLDNYSLERYSESSWQSRTPQKCYPSPSTCGPHTAIEMTDGLQTQRAQHYKLCSSFIQPWDILFMLEAGELQTSQVRWKLKNISKV